MIESDEILPSDIEEISVKTVGNLLPVKSKEIYTAAYGKYQVWCQSMGHKAPLLFLNYITVLLINSFYFKYSDSILLNENYLFKYFSSVFQNILNLYVIIVL